MVRNYVFQLLFPCGIITGKSVASGTGYNLRLHMWMEGVLSSHKQKHYYLHVLHNIQILVLSKKVKRHLDQKDDIETHIFKIRI